MEATLPIGSDNLPVTIATMVLCVILVALLAGSEAALLSVSKIRIRNLAEQGVKSALAVAKLVEKHDKLFATILTTENFFIIIASSLGTATALKMFGPEMLIWASLVLTILVVIFGEITPKTFAAQNAEKVSLLVARPMLWLVTITSPFISILSAITAMLLRLTGQHGRVHSPFVTEEELRMMIDVSSTEGVLQHEERELLQNVFEFGDTVASEVMISRTRVIALEDDTTLRDLLHTAAETGHSRYPIYHESIDTVVGIIHLKDALVTLAGDPAAMDQPILALMKPPVFIPENKKIAELLPLMQKRRLQMVVVADEFGGTEGIVTIENLLEEIVGDIDDEHHVDDEAEVQTVDEKTAVVDGTVTIDDVNDQVQINLPYGPYQTLAGFIMTQLGHIPHAGEKLIYDSIEFTITEVHGPRVDKVTIVKA
jgi:CBS domain containing-hemolysin-like protein